MVFRLLGAASSAWARFWVDFMLWNLERQPGIVRSTKPFFTFFAWRTCSPLRNNLLANSKWLLGHAASTQQRARLGKRVLSNFYDFMVNIARSQRHSVEQILAEIGEIQGRQRYGEIRSLHRGAILVTAHLGCFETSVAALAREEQRIHIVFRRDPVQRFERLRSAQRRKFGVIESPVDDGLGVWVRLRDALRNDEVVLMQGDRILPGQKGERVPFMGGHMMVPMGAVKLAMASGAPIIPVFAPRGPDGGVKIILEEPIFLENNDPAPMDAHCALLELTRVIERYVQEYPEQWLVFHRAWCEDAEQRA